MSVKKKADVRPFITFAPYNDTSDRSFNYCSRYFIIPAIKTEVDHENRELQAEVASLERERARIVSEVDRLKEDLERTKAKLADKNKIK